ncbi:MAG: hypothetical protein A2X12_04155 [Bacteroidetes bacterium GWE2_29_8]|nr:MAG: hypothetical protein A2X12_04155 [Bacteroidetes bacterium GWE2_29_8]OFY24974.1 MAG: hypothetical protein A2X02_08000 [Bacteroidetes bacterium GWF2_29_10]
MRIVTGFLGGRSFSPSNDFPARPTKDLAKESVFNIINNYFEFKDISTLDLFGGTGNITYEFISRGVNFATVVENEVKCVKFIKETSVKFKITDNIMIIKNDVYKYLENCNSKYDIIFADPPYDSDSINLIPQLVFKNNILKDSGWLIVEHPKEVSFQMKENIFDQRKYGKSFFSFFKHN